MGITAGISAHTTPAGFWRRLFLSPNGVIGLMIVLGLIFCATFAEILAPYDHAKMCIVGRFLPPSSDFVL